MQALTGVDMIHYGNITTEMIYMALKNKTFRIDDSIVEALAQKATTLDISESEVVRKALICFLGIKFDNDCASYDELQEIKTRFDALLEHLKITSI